ncbi:hypothetical protein LT85_1466 [Collimonas arenae]|uniref:DUF1127 domain-containing protein n=1 Tax=Collimonas arenae TaxID=279058 RepID=A0A0A1FAB9_9BURK|nr:hypothetical protein LT85_1466 [Collimonas arenae]
MEEFGKLTERAAGWWRQRQIPARPATEQRRRLSSTRELSDHVLRDIGFIDALPPPADPQEDKPY